MMIVNLRYQERIPRMIASVRRGLSHRAETLIWLTMTFLLVPAPTLTVAQENSWVPINGLSNGTITAITISRSGSVFLATRNGVYRSTDDGINWRLHTFDSLDRYNTINAFLNTRNGTIFAGGYGRMYSSGDDGETWIHSLDSSYTFTSFAVDSAGRIFAGTQSQGFGEGIFRSTDEGTTWTKSDTGLVRPSIVSLAVLSNGHLFAGSSGSGVFRSTDHGSSWITVNPGTKSPYIQTMMVTKSDKIIVSTLDRGLYRSTDEGESWEEISDSSAPQGVVTFTMSVSGDILAGRYSGGVFSSIDDGEHWAKIDSNLSNVQISGIADSPSGSLYAGTSDGVFRSTDGGVHWIQLATGLSNASVICLLIGPSNRIITGLGRSYSGYSHPFGVYSSTNNGQTWLNLGPRGIINAFALSTSNDMLAAVSGDGVTRSTDQGVSWQALEFGVYPITGYQIASSPSGSIFASTSHGIYRSHDNGNTWTNTDSALFFNSYLFSPSGAIIAGRNYYGIYRSTDDGDHWLLVDSTMKNDQILSFAITKTGDILAGTYYRGIFRSTNDGVTWSRSDSSVVNVASFAINTEGVIFTSAAPGNVYRSTDNGFTWTVFTQGLGYADIYPLAIDSGGYLVAGAHGQGVYRTVRPTITSFELSRVDIPSLLVLRQNYPNPANPSTSIEFELKAFGHVTLKIYDLLGKEVTSLIDDEMAPGRYTRTWNAGDVPTGVYFCRLQAGRSWQVRKILVLR